MRERIRKSVIEEDGDHLCRILRSETERERKVNNEEICDRICKVERAYPVSHITVSPS